MTLATTLAELVNEEVEEGQPISMTRIRYHAKRMQTEFTERHYYEYGNWFSEFKFPDQSTITFGEDDYV